MSPNRDTHKTYVKPPPSDGWKMHFFPSNKNGSAVRHVKRRHYPTSRVPVRSHLRHPRRNLSHQLSIKPGENKAAYQPNLSIKPGQIRGPISRNQKATFWGPKKLLWGLGRELIWPEWIQKPTIATLWFWGFWGSLAPHLVGKYIIPGSLAPPNMTA